MKKLFLFRHGETEWNKIGRIQGHTDIPLNEKGESQAAILTRALPRLKLDAILSSDLIRAFRTAEIGSAGLDITIHQDKGIRESFFGEAEGMTFDEMNTKFGKRTMEKWHSNLFKDNDFCLPGGENGGEVLSRVQKSITQFFMDHPKVNRLGISTHGGVIRRLVHGTLPEGYPRVPIPNGIIYPLDFDSQLGRWSFGSYIELAN